MINLKIAALLCGVVLTGSVAAATASHDLTQCAAGPCSDWHTKGQADIVYAGDPGATSGSMFSGLSRWNHSSIDRENSLATAGTSSYKGSREDQISKEKLIMASAFVGTAMVAFIAGAPIWAAVVLGFMGMIVFGMIGIGIFVDG